MFITAFVFVDFLNKLKRKFPLESYRNIFLYTKRFLFGFISYSEVMILTFIWQKKLPAPQSLVLDWSNKLLL